MKKLLLTIVCFLFFQPCFGDQSQIVKANKEHHSDFLNAEKEAPSKELKIRAGNVIDIGSDDLSCKLVRGDVKNKIFHGPGCRYFDCKDCVNAFPGRHEAIKAGYKPCGICKP